MPTYTVTRDDDGIWNVRRDGRQVTEAGAHCDAEEVLRLAEQFAGQPMAWKLIGGGFESLGSLEILRRLGEEYQQLAHDETHDSELPGMWEQADLTGGETDR